MDVPITCPICHEDNGSTGHLFFDCSFARRLWSATSLSQTIDTTHTSRGECWFCELIRTNNAGMAEIILMLCDSLWMQRNQHTFTDQKLEAEYMAISVATNLRSFQNANGWSERFSEALHEKSLLRPVPSKTSIRFDAGISYGNATVGVIALNGDRGFIKAVMDVFPGITDPLYAEGRAMVTDISVANDLGLEDVQLVGDCLTLIKMVRCEETMMSGCADLIRDIRELLSVGRLANTCWIPRNQNNTAHALARYAKNNVNGRLSWDLAPTLLLSNDSGRFQ